jgi:hypothetical protein
MVFRRNSIVYVFLYVGVDGRFDEMANILFADAFNNAFDKADERTGAGQVIQPRFCCGN